MTCSLTTIGKLPRAALGALFAVAVGGCSSHPAAIAPPDVDPAELSEAILDDLDKDGNRNLSKTELEGMPAVLDRIADYDADGNGEVSPGELSARLARVFDGQTGLMAVACRVTRNGKPLKGANVYFVPVSYLNGALPVASGVTLSNGTTVPSIQLADLPPNSPQRQGFIRPGLYQIEVTHAELKIPEKYNIKTTLGREVSPQVALAGAIDLPLDF